MSKTRFYASISNLPSIFTFVVVVVVVVVVVLIIITIVG